jgi:hypothetical protein
MATGLAAGFFATFAFGDLVAFSLSLPDAPVVTLISDMENPIELIFHGVTAATGILYRIEPNAE